MDTKELEALNLLHYSPIDENGGVLGPSFLAVPNHLLSLGYVEGEVVILAPPGQDLQTGSGKCYPNTILCTDRGYSKIKLRTIKNRTLAAPSPIQPAHSQNTSRPISLSDPNFHDRGSGGTAKSPLPLLLTLTLNPTLTLTLP